MAAELLQKAFIRAAWRCGDMTLLRAPIEDLGVSNDPQLQHREAIQSTQVEAGYPHHDTVGVARWMRLVARHARVMYKGVMY